MGRKTSVYLAADVDAAVRASGQSIPGLLRVALGLDGRDVSELEERVARLERQVEQIMEQAGDRQW